jgi:hypothetical protein
VAGALLDRPSNMSISAGQLLAWHVGWQRSDPVPLAGVKQTLNQHDRRARSIASLDRNQLRLPSRTFNPSTPACIAVEFFHQINYLDRHIRTIPEARPWRPHGKSAAYILYQPRLRLRQRM